MILLYTPHQTPRLAYIARYLFTSILGVPVAITSNREEYSQYTLPKINYSSERVDGITLCPHALLFEESMHELTPEFIRFQNTPALFPVQQPSGLPFDPLAAAFYMVSRYEEYLPKSTDQHNRTLPKQSVAYQHDFLEIPVVDHWALMLRHLIENHYPDFQFPEKKYRFIPTIDVDTAYAYKYRGLLRTTGAALKSALKGDLKDNKRRFQTLFLNQPDPFDTFGLLQNWHSQYNLTPRFFFHVGHYGRFDKNISPFHPAIRRLIKQTSQLYPVGVHPSYQSNYKVHGLKHETDTLSKIIGNRVTRSRQHFLVLKFPETYQQLIRFEIDEDFTMGYAHLPGFRAGTCTPFPFFDLTTETETKLMVYPFQVMDGTLNQYLRLSPLEAIEYISRLNSEVRKVHGTFISLWHNESLSEMHRWKNWREVYEALLQIAS